MKRPLDAGHGAVDAQLRAEFGDSGVGLFFHKLGQTRTVDLERVLADAVTRRGLTILAPPLVHAAHPGGADVERLTDVLIFSARS